MKLEIQKVRLVIRILLLSILPALSFGQSLHPKDTVYIKFEMSDEDDSSTKKRVIYDSREGIRYSILTKTGRVTLFHDLEKDADTLSVEHYTDFPGMDLEQIVEMHNLWIRNPQGDKPRPPGGRNEVFETFVIEKLEPDKMLVVPVEWVK